MYEKPTLERFGTLRELTQLGSAGGSDIATAFGLSASCNPDDAPGSDFGCRS